MARNISNILLRHYSGKVNNMVIQSNGIVRSLPDISGRIWSSRQQMHLTRIEEAKNYARGVLTDPEKKAEYEQTLPKWKKKMDHPNIGVYQLAIRDYYHPPNIRRIKYKQPVSGTKGSIEVDADDEFCISAVAVEILSTKGNVIESGSAVWSDLHDIFTYPVQKAHLLKPGCAIKVTVTDRPGNITSQILNLK